MEVQPTNRFESWAETFYIESYVEDTCITKGIVGDLEAIAGKQNNMVEDKLTTETKWFVQKLKGLKKLQH